MSRVRGKERVLCWNDIRNLPHIFININDNDVIEP